MAHFPIITTIWVFKKMLMQIKKVGLSLYIRCKQMNIHHLKKVRSQLSENLTQVTFSPAELSTPIPRQHSMTARRTCLMLRQSNSTPWNLFYWFCSCVWNSCSQLLGLQALRTKVKMQAVPCHYYALAPYIKWSDLFGCHRVNGTKGAPGKTRFYFEVKCGKRKKEERETYSGVWGSGRTEGFAWEHYITLHRENSP